MTIPPAQPPTETGEEQEEQITPQEQTESAEKSAQTEQQEYLQQEIPETQIGGAVLNALSAIGLTYTSNKLERVEAFDVLNDSNYEHNLLKVRDTRKFRQIKQAQARVRDEIEKQRKRELQKAQKGEKARDYAQVGTGPLKRVIKFADYDRKIQACDIADAVHRRINASEIKIKLNNAMSIYGLSDPDLIKQLKGGLAQWQKDNPGKSIDDYLCSSQARELYRAQCKKNGQVADKKEEREKVKKLQKQNESAQIDAVKENREQIIRAQQSIKKRIDPNQPLLSDEQKKQEIASVLHGTAQPQVAPTPAPTPSTTPSASPSKPLVGKISLFNRFNNFRNKVAADIKNRLVQLFAPLKRLFDRVNVVRTAIVNSIKSVITTFAKKAFSTVVRLGTKILGKLGLKALGQALATIVPGIGNAVVAILQFLGIDELFLKGFIFVFKVFVGIIIVMIILIPLGLLGSIAFTPQKTTVVSPSENKTYSWNDFESRFLSLDPNRHDNMKK